MRRKGIVSDEIVQSIDVANTLNGGISEPRVNLSQFPEYRQVQLYVPGIREENMHVKINNNQLVIYFERQVETRENMITIPFIAYNKSIPYFIDAEKISAHYDDGVLTVQLPFNELADGYHRDIPIDK
jgi:HSP20 family molecular chaperone IbpA